MYKIFFNDRLIYLTDKTDSRNKDFQDLYYLYHDEDELKKTIRKFEMNTNIHELLIYNEYIDELFNAFKNCFHFVEAAGGIVKNLKDELLIIERFNKLDLPKGKCEKNEKYHETALREVSEECGINKLEIIRFLTSTFHTFYVDDKPVLKKTHWFEMRYHGNEPVIVQTEEQITSYMWLQKNQINSIFPNTYASLIDVFNVVIHQ